jgi:hypothetical protein
MPPFRARLALPYLLLALAAAAAPAIADTATIAELRAAIERDQDRLKDLLRASNAESEIADLQRDPELRALAHRLPQLQQALREAEAHEAAADPSGR